MTAKWRIISHDTFSREDYGLGGDYATEAEAEMAARARLAELELSQPTATSGGQDAGGIQDRVFVIAPDGTRRRITP